jgi:hypothetical protein
MRTVETVEVDEYPLSTCVGYADVGSMLCRTVTWDH